MIAKLLKPYPIGYIQIMEGATVVIIEEYDLDYRVSYMDYTFRVSKEDLEIIK